ncbi:aldo/keto reductase [Romboutsia sp.]|uniref:aldo/keto reductase n=1 Tax=Romboutsia sp. TaxID=1965302 RepID=UPI003F35C439
MLYRELGKTKEQVSLLGFGCMRFPKIEEKIDEEQASEMLKYAIENGINYLDTAYPYHDGQSEPFVGKFLKENNLRDKVKLATKLPSWAIKNKEDMYKYFNSQLERLQTDYIDFYLVHNLSKDYWINLLENGLFEFLDEIKASGKVKHIGFSFHDNLTLFKEIVDSYDWEFAQIQYNYIDEEYQAGTEGLKYAYEKGLGVIIMEPLRGGKLANKISDELLDIIKGNKVDKTPVDLAFQFIYDKKEVGLVLSGMSTLEHVKDNIRIVNELGRINSLTENESNAIDSLCKAMKEKIKVSCTDCRYCLPCPAGVNIPKCFELYNDASMFNDVEGGKFAYTMFVKGNNEEASKCVKCGKCEEACPQNIEIINNLETIKNTFEG